MTGEELERIYNDAYKAVYWTAISLLKNEADAEDIVQDSFIAFIESYSDIKDTTKATALLKKIAANKCLDRIKLAKTDTVGDEFFEDVEAVPEDFLPDSIVESEDARRIIMDIIENSLSEDIRRTLILFYFDDMSTKEIAEALSVPEGTVRRRLNFARNKVKKEVEKYEKDNKTKLFGMALPFLSKLFMKEAEQVPFKVMPAKLISLSASAQASHAGAATKIAASAAKKGTGIMINKIVIGGVASVVAVGVTVGVILTIVNKPGRPPETTENTEISENEEVKETTANNGNSTAGTSDRNTGYYDDESWYYIQDMTPEEIADLYIYYFDSAHELTVDNVEDFEQYLLVKPEKYKIDEQHDNVDVFYTSYVGNKTDHIEFMEVDGFDRRNEIEFAMDCIVFDQDKAIAVVEAIKDHYAAEGADIEEHDLNGMYDGGYKIKINKDQTLTVNYTALEVNGIVYYEIRFSEL